MRRAKILLTLGIWTAILPYLGFPYIYKNILFLLSGLGIIWISYLLYREHRKDVDNFDSFSENSGFAEK